MRTCSVFGCKERVGGNFKLHALPKDPKFRNIWVIACGRTDVKVGVDITGYICSKHFSPNQYKRNLVLELCNRLEKSYRGLKETAVPDQNLPLSDDYAPLMRGKA